MHKFKQIAEDHGFNVAEERLDGIACIKGNLIVIVSQGKEQDGKEWRHVSLSRRNKYPPYEEIKRIKNIFIGSDEKAMMIFPKETNHVNIHQYCFHLYSCIDGDSLPDFDRGMGTI